MISKKYPVKLSRDHYNGRDAGKREKAAEHNRLASRAEDYINAASNRPCCASNDQTEQFSIRLLRPAICTASRASVRSYPVVRRALHSASACRHHRAELV
jgi:hypothetical protein